MDTHARPEYARRMQRVQAYIDSHLSEPLVLAELAAVANFSAFHFHRQFAAWMGEPLGAYLRRRRSEVAAVRLVEQPDTLVDVIATGVGFGSSEDFAQAFTHRFGCSAGDWRRLTNAQREARQRVPERARSPASPGAGAGDALALKVSVHERPPVRVVYLRHLGPYGASVARYWQQRFYPYIAQRGLTQRHCYGVSHDDPDITAPQNCRFDVCAEVDEDFVATGEGLITTIPGGRYAVLPFLGTPATIRAAWSALLCQWLPTSGWQLDARPTFEHYPPDARYNEATGEFSCNIMAPLVPL